MLVMLTDGAHSVSKDGVLCLGVFLEQGCPEGGDGLMPHDIPKSEVPDGGFFDGSPVSEGSPDSE